VTADIMEAVKLRSTKSKKRMMGSWSPKNWSPKAWGRGGFSSSRAPALDVEELVNGYVELVCDDLKITGEWGQ